MIHKNVVPCFHAVDCADVLSTPSFDSHWRFKWVAELLELVTSDLWCQYGRSHFWSLHIDSLIVRSLYLIVPHFFSTLNEIVEIHRIDLQHDDDNVEVLNWKTTSLELLATYSIAELRVHELTRKLFRTIIHAVDGLRFSSTLLSMSLNLEVIGAAVRLVARPAATSTCSYATVDVLGQHVGIVHAANSGIVTLLPPIIPDVVNHVFGSCEEVRVVALQNCPSIVCFWAVR